MSAGADKNPAGASSSVALYVHLPWCERKCPYCDFNSHKAPDRIPQRRYIDALVADLRSDLRRMHCCGVRPASISSLFLGGGTPSLFVPDNIAALLNAINEIIPLVADCEVTMEANPGSLETGRLPGFRNAGVNRLSLGVQSLKDEHLRTIGRTHSAAQARDAIEYALVAGFDRINVDLMYALPHQSVQDVLDDLAVVERYGLRHLSWYEMTIEPNTAFGWRPPVGLPTEDKAIVMRREGDVFLGACGLQAYEVSAYARARQDRCRHNLNYWNYGDYMGIGAGAHGKLTLPATGQVLRGHKRRSPLSYMKFCLDVPQQLSADQLSTPAFEYHEVVEPESATDEFLLNALRLADGFGLDQWSRCTRVSAQTLLTAAASLIGEGHIRFQDDRFSVAPGSMALLDEVLARLCGELECVRGASSGLAAKTKSGTSADRSRTVPAVFVRESPGKEKTHPISKTYKMPGGTG